MNQDYQISGMEQGVEMDANFGGNSQGGGIDERRTHNTASEVIRVSKITKDILDTLKIVNRESYD